MPQSRKESIKAIPRITTVIGQRRLMKFDRFGKWWVIIWKEKNKMVEIGLGARYQDGSFDDIYQMKSYRFLFFFLTVSRPTMKYLQKKTWLHKMW